MIPNLPSNIDLINYCADIYAPDVSAKEWDHLDLGLDDGVFWALKKIDDCDVVVFRGSITVRDWLRDIIALPLKTEVGSVHAGFYLGMEKAWSELKPMLSGAPLAVTGHSLGASHANILCGLMIKDGIVPEIRMVAGEPKPGLQDFCDHLQIIRHQFSFVNGASHRHDIVTDVPLSFPPLLPFTRPTPLTKVTAWPTQTITEMYGDAFAFHHIQLYQQGITNYYNLNKRAA